MDWLSKLPRTIRRAYEQGSPSERLIIRAEHGPRAPFFVREVDGRIEIPVIATMWFIKDLSWMMPYADLPNDYKVTCTRDDGKRKYARSPADYVALIHTWFHCGLQVCEIKLRPNVFSQEADTMKAFKVYLNTLLRSFEPSQEHKMAYLAYVCHTCCEHIDWQML